MNPAARRPNPVSKRRIYEQQPHRREYRECRKLHALGKRAGNERRRNRGKEKLESRKREVRNRRRQRGIRRFTYVRKTGELERPDNMMNIRPKRQRIPH